MIRRRRGRGLPGHIADDVNALLEARGEFLSPAPRGIRIGGRGDVWESTGEHDQVELTELSRVPTGLPAASEGMLRANPGYVIAHPSSGRTPDKTTSRGG